MPEIAKKLTNRTSKNSSVASLYRALADAS